MSDEIESTKAPFDTIAQVDEDGIEYWWARDLMGLMGYTQWRNFNLAIGRARVAMADDETYDPKDHFWSLRRSAGSGRPIDTNFGTPTADQGGRPYLDFRLTREACYFIAINGDPMKSEIAAAQKYFVLQTMRMEAIEKAVQQQPAAVAMPTHVDALRGWADALEAREKAELQTLQAQAEADLLRPPAEAWTHLADVGQDYSVREACYILRRDPAISGIGPQKLFKWIVDNKMAERRPDGQYLPYAAHMDHLRLRIQTRPDYDDNVLALRKEANSQLRVTVKGLEWMQQRLRDQGKPDLTGRIPRQPIAPPTESEMEEPEAEDAPIDFDKYRRAALASQLKR